MIDVVLVTWMFYRSAFYDDLTEAPVVTCVAVAEELPDGIEGYPPQWCRGWA